MFLNLKYKHTAAKSSKIITIITKIFRIINHTNPASNQGFKGYFKKRCVSDHVYNKKPLTIKIVVSG